MHIQTFITRHTLGYSGMWQLFHQSCKYFTTTRYFYSIFFFHRWPMYLVRKGYRPTSIKNMCTHVTQFLRHIETSFKGVFKVSTSDFAKMAYEIKRLQAEVSNKVVVHWQEVLRQKTSMSLHNPHSDFPRSTFQLFVFDIPASTFQLFTFQFYRLAGFKSTYL